MKPQKWILVQTSQAEFKAATPWFSEASTFAPGSIQSTLRHIFLAALHFGNPVWVIDVKDAYLNVPQDESEYVYMVEAPASVCNHYGVQRISWRCARLIPGQRIAANKWFEYVDKLLCSAELESFPQVPTIYRGTVCKTMCASLHVDDFVLSGPAQAANDVMEVIKKTVMLSIAGPFVKVGDRFEYLKKVFEFVPGGLVIRMNEKHLDKMIELAGVRSTFTKKVPCPSDALAEDETSELDPERTKTYRSLVGVMLYIVSERPDIAFTVRALSARMANPSEKMLKIAVGLVGYLQFTPGVGIVLKKSWPGKRVLDNRGEADVCGDDQHVVEAICDADFAACKTTRRSISSGQVFINGALVLAFSRTQRAVTLSSGESEFMALVHTLSEAILVADAWRFLVRDRATELEARTGSSACRGIANRRGVGKVRHLDAGALWVQGAIAEKKVSLKPIGTMFNPADIGTKPLTGYRLRMLCCLIGMVKKDNSAFGEAELLEARQKEIIGHSDYKKLICLISALQIRGSRGCSSYDRPAREFEIGDGCFLMCAIFFFMVIWMNMCAYARERKDGFMLKVVVGIVMVCSCLRTMEMDTMSIGSCVQ